MKRSLLFAAHHWNKWAKQKGLVFALFLLFGSHWSHSGTIELVGQANPSTPSAPAANPAVEKIKNQVVNTDSGDLLKAAGDLEKSICADPKLNGKKFIYENGKDESSSDLEANCIGCAKADINKATNAGAVKKLKETASAVANIVKPSANEATLKREIAYLEYLNCGVTAFSTCQTQEYVDQVASQLEFSKKDLAGYKEAYETEFDVAEALKALNLGQGKIGDEQRFKRLAKRIDIQKASVLANIPTLEQSQKQVGQKIEELKAQGYQNKDYYPGASELSNYELNYKEYAKVLEQKRAILAEIDAVESWLKENKEGEIADPIPTPVLLKAITSELPHYKASLTYLEQQTSQAQNLLNACKEQFTKANEANKTTGSEKTKNAKLNLQQLATRLRSLENKCQLRQNISYKIDTLAGVTCGMSLVELHAIDNYAGNGYKTLNKALRSGDQQTIKNVQPFTDALNAALAKLKPYGGVVRRGAYLPKEVLEKHVVGSTLTYESFTSTSVGRGFGAEHRFIIKSKTGRYIDPFAARGEWEVLFRAGTKFKILSREQRPGVTEFVMEEVGK